MNYRDQLVLTGALDDVGNPIRQTSGKSYRLGLEVEGNFRINNKLKKPFRIIDNNIDFNRDLSSYYKKLKLIIILQL